MYYVYVIKYRKTRELYYGLTNNLKRRLREHSKEGYFKVIYYEAYSAEADARERERKLKNYGQSRTHLKKRLKRSLES